MISHCDNGPFRRECGKDLLQMRVLDGNKLSCVRNAFLHCITVNILTTSLESLVFSRPYSYSHIETVHFHRMCLCLTLSHSLSLSLTYTRSLSLLLPLSGSLSHLRSLSLSLPLSHSSSLTPSLSPFFSFSLALSHIYLDQ